MKSLRELREEKKKWKKSFFFGEETNFLHFVQWHQYFSLCCFCCQNGDAFDDILVPDTVNSDTVILWRNVRL